MWYLFQPLRTKEIENQPRLKIFNLESNLTCTIKINVNFWLMNPFFGGGGGQRAKKVVSDSPGLVDFVNRRVNSEVKFFEKFKLQKNCEINLLMKTTLGLVKMMFGLVNVSYNLSEWQALKMTFFAPWERGRVGVVFSLMTEIWWINRNCC